MEEDAIAQYDELLDERESAYGTAIEVFMRLYNSPDATLDNCLKEFGRLVRVYRESRSMTQSELARQLFVGRSWINRIESGDGRPSRNLVIHLGFVLGLKTPEVNILLYLCHHNPIFKKRGDKGIKGLLLL